MLKTCNKDNIKNSNLNYLLIAFCDVVRRFEKN